LYGSTCEQHSACRSDNTSAVRLVGVASAWTKPDLWIAAVVLMLLTEVTTADLPSSDAFGLFPCSVYACCRLVLALCASLPPTALRRRYGARTIVNAHWQDFWRNHDPRALVRIELPWGYFMPTLRTESGIVLIQYKFCIGVCRRRH
jgi:hypothetical protein